MTQEILDTFEEEKGHMNPTIKPIQGTITEGEYEGFTFSWLGYNDIVPFINPFKIYSVMKGTKPPIKGLSLKHIPFEDALPLRYKLTTEIMESIGVRKRK